MLGGPAAIERHTSALRSWLYDQLAGLRHSNGAPLLRILGRHHWPNARSVQVGTLLEGVFWFERRAWTCEAVCRRCCCRVEEI